MAIQPLEEIPYRADGVLLPIQTGEMEPGQGVVEIAPDPRKRVQLWTIRRHTCAACVCRERQPLGRMRATVVQEQKFQASRERLREGVDEV